MKDYKIDGNTSDGYHTFDELYEHRNRLYIELCRSIAIRAMEKNHENPVWLSAKHSDGSRYTGWIVLGIFYEKGKQITYHIQERFFSEVNHFATYLEKAPEYDGHTSNDVVQRLAKL